MKKQSAFTLAELMLAMLFLSIALFAYVSLQIRLIYSTSKLEQHQLECEQANVTLVGNIGTARANYASATDVPGGPPGLKQITATSTWDDRNGSQSFTVDTFIRPMQSGW